jgi:uncharacterized membrane protein
MRPDSATVVAGIVVPSSDPVFLALVAVHVAIAIVCVIAGLGAMLSKKGSRRHRTYGTTYYALLGAVFISATVLSAMRWDEDYHLFLLGLLSFSAASYGRMAQRRRWRNAARLHLAAMGTSYTLLLIAFYVDNGRNLPLWRALPPIAYWLLPSVLGAIVITYVSLRHPLTRHGK